MPYAACAPPLLYVCAAYSLLYGVYMGKISKLFHCKINEDKMV